MVGCLLTTGVLGEIVLRFVYLSSGVAAAAMFVPLICALLPGKIDQRWVLVPVSVGAMLAIVFGFWDVLPIDGTAVGVLGSVLCAIGGISMNRIRKRTSEDL